MTDQPTAPGDLATYWVKRLRWSTSQSGATAEDVYSAAHSIITQAIMHDRGEHADARADDPVADEPQSLIALAESRRVELVKAREAIESAIRFLASDPDAAINWSGDINALLMSYVEGHDAAREAAQVETEELRKFDIRQASRASVEQMQQKYGVPPTPALAGRGEGEDEATVERVARALHAKDAQWWSHIRNDSFEVSRTYFIEMARAALGARAGA